MVNIAFGKKFADTLLLGVGDKDLSETVASHQVDDAVHAPVVEFVENIVEEQHGFEAHAVFGVVELSQFDGDDEGFLLPL